LGFLGAVLPVVRRTDVAPPGRIAALQPLEGPLDVNQATVHH
jgi:hypothetical protein